MRTDKTPFNDVRVRRAISLAIDRQGIIDAVYEGVGVVNPAVPAALKEWAVPIDQLGEGARYYKYDPAQARKLLADAGYPNGFPATVSFTTYGSTVLVDTVQLVLKYLKEVGIDAKLDQQEYGAFIATHRPSASSTRWPTGRRRRSSIPTTSSTARTCRASSRTRAT